MSADVSLQVLWVKEGVARTDDYVPGGRHGFEVRVTVMLSDSRI